MIVALANSEVRLYNPKDKNLIHIMRVDVSTYYLKPTILCRTKSAPCSMEYLEGRKDALSSMEEAGGLLSRSFRDKPTCKLLISLVLPQSRTSR